MKRDGEITCPVTKVAQLLSDSWTILIVYRLNHGPKRFCELERSLEGISTRTLTLKLKKLIEEGMIIKDDQGVYMSTERGKGLKLIENAMRRYEKEYL
ncbi:MAG TPA: helix-turn-helix domain-containing protein [Candidatus Paceibacterota bacterium]|nr:helix-turn-helix domain-containing protein [Candidatus Paceibacterota bacterium]